MKNKWFISAFIFALAIVGISLEQASVPNQEIVLQFTDVEVTLDETEEAISLIKSQLEALDVANIQIQKSGNGALKITYYSDIHVSEIKKIVLKKRDVTVNQTLYTPAEDDSELPLKEEVISYQIDVHEIRKNVDIVGSSGNVLEPKSEIIRFFTPDVYAPVSKQKGVEKNKAEKLAYTIHSKNAIAIEDSSCHIPEVRAGPVS